MAEKSIQSRIRELPQDVLNRGFQMVGAGRDIWLAGLGAVEVAQEEGTSLFSNLVKRGEHLETEGRKAVSEISVRELPQDVLKAGLALPDRGRDIWKAGLGAMEKAQQEGSNFFNTLVERGQKLENKGRQQVDALRDEISTRQNEIQKEVTDRVEMASEPLLNALKRFGVPTRAEVRDLAASVDALSKKVDSLLTRLEREPAETAAQPAPRGEARKEQKETAPARESATAKETVFMVVAREDEGWALRKEGRQSDVSVHGTKEEALEEARSYASERAPSRLEIYKKDGGLQDTIFYTA